MTRDANDIACAVGPEGLRLAWDAANAKHSVLDNVADFLRRFVAYPSEHALVAHALWIAHCHLMGAWESTPRICFLSPVRGSGKTRALEITELLVPSPIHTVNASVAYIFRKIGDPDGLPKVLFDECDVTFGPRASKDNEEIRGLINAGHRRGAVTGRCVVRGKIIETEETPAYAPVALAGLGRLPDTILSRSVVIRMKRRAPNEKVEPYRRRLHEKAGHELRDRVADWAAGKADYLSTYIPPMPAGIADRDADVWEALLAIADASGGDWPHRAREAAVTLVTESRKDPPNLGVRLLRDIREVWQDDKPAKFTKAILDALLGMPDSPWAEVGRDRKPLSAKQMADLLAEYDITPDPHWVDKVQGRGYARTAFEDAWRRYLSASTVGVTSVTAVAEQETAK